jgi:dolichyl-phosphate-mannose-protein mannosyltransferase
VHDRPGFPPYDVGVVAMTGLEPAPRPEHDKRPPSLRQWLAPAIPGSRLLGWLGPLAVTLFAGLLRFYDLGKPRAVIFDETYYAKDAYALLKFGYEHNTVKNADKLLLQHPPNHAIWSDGGSFVAHPPAGKWLIAVGEWMFGMTPFGWRFAAALVGTLSVLIMARVARRMTRSTLLGTAAGLLLALDGMHLVTSRTAILDIFVMFWILAGFACLVIDRDRTRATLARKVMESGNEADLGPFVMHWWRLAAGLCLGTAVATKWTGVYYIAVFGVMVLLWDAGARRAAGIRRPYAGGFALDAVPAFLSLVVLSGITYVAWWSGWIFNAGGWGRGRVAGNPITAFTQAMPRLWSYHQQMWHFHTTLTVKHDYQSWPWNWMVLKRPVAFFYTEPSGCGATKCSREVLGIGTPAIWWVSIITLVVIAGWRDGRGLPRRLAAVVLLRPRPPHHVPVLRHADAALHGAVDRAGHGHHHRTGRRAADPALLRRAPVRGVRPARPGQLLLPVSRARGKDPHLQRLVQPDVVQLMDLKACTRVWRDGKLENESFPADRISDYLAEPGTIVWLDLCAPDSEGLRLISEEFGLDPLAVEDATSHHERPKLDRYEGHLFLNAYAVRLVDDSGRLETHEISAFVTERALVTVRGDEEFDTDALIKQWDSSPDLARYGVAYLLHGLLDLVVDQHFEAVQSLDTAIEGLEDRLFDDAVPDREAQRRGYQLRKSVTLLRRVVLPMREVVNSLLRRDLKVVPEEMAPYFQDVYDHVLRATEWIESLRDVVTNLQETRIAMQGNHLNQVMKKLTGWAAVIAVPTAVTGFYGQNVPYPGFGKHWGFLVSLAVLIGTALALYAVFKRRDWL